MKEKKNSSRSNASIYSFIHSGGIIMRKKRRERTNQRKSIGIFLFCFLFVVFLFFFVSMISFRWERNRDL